MLPRLVLILLAALLLAAGPAPAHGPLPAGPVIDIAIPSLTHGQMAVIARHRGEILALAALRTGTDAPFRRVMNYANLQFTYCLWGLVPGSIADETSPFNECSHAYLAATRALLLRMAERPDPAVAALLRRVEWDMMQNATGLVLCQYSDEAFDTARLIRPDWRAVATHPESLGFLAAAALALAAAALALWRLTAAPHGTPHGAPRGGS